MDFVLSAFCAVLLVLKGTDAQFLRCEKIVTPLCQRLGYNTTLMPNFMGHDDQRSAALGVSFECVLGRARRPAKKWNAALSDAIR